MCGGFLGHVLGEIDPVFKKNNPYERKKRIEGEKIAEADRNAALATQADEAAKIDNNQVVQAEIVSSRRRRAAQSLLASGNPFAKDDPYGYDGASSNLARGRATGARPAAVSLGG